MRIQHAQPFTPAAPRSMRHFISCPLIRNHRSNTVAATSGEQAASSSSSSSGSSKSSGASKQQAWAPPSGILKINPALLQAGGLDVSREGPQARASFEGHLTSLFVPVNLDYPGLSNQPAEEGGGLSGPPNPPPPHSRSSSAGNDDGGQDGVPHPGWTSFEAFLRIPGIPQCIGLLGLALAIAANASKLGSDIGRMAFPKDSRTGGLAVASSAFGVEAMDKATEVLEVALTMGVEALDNATSKSVEAVDKAGTKGVEAVDKAGTKGVEAAERIMWGLLGASTIFGLFSIIQNR
ncbi:hypothetical protein Vafri_8289 [Volvox africanus]|nr:hypothetical protein Vafri_8289 [Volvox africanus]